MEILGWGVWAWAALSLGAAGPVTITVLANESMPQSGLVQGKPAGMAVDILNAVTTQGGPAFRFDFSRPWARALREVHERPDLAIIPLSRAPEREADFRWIAELFENDGRLLSLKRAAPIRSLDEARDLHIGVLRGSVFEPWLRQHGFTHVEAQTDDAFNVRKLKAGHIDAWAGSESVQRYLFASTGGDPAQLQQGPRLGKPPEIYIAGDRRFPEAEARAIAEGVAKLRRSGRLAAILRSYGPKRADPR
jgi:polar amino acid transport system substrate-binding protein